MRPLVLTPLFAGVSTLPGIGPKVAETLGRLLGAAENTEPRIVDLLFHLPAALIDRRNQPGIALAPEGGIVTLKVRVDRHQPSPRGNGRIPYRVFVHDDSGELALVYFHANRAWLERTLPVGKILYVSGEVAWFNGRAQIVHPDHVLAESELGSLPMVEPVYPMTAGLARKTLLKATDAALAGLPALPEWAPPERLVEAGWPAFSEALRRAHHPDAPADLEPISVPRMRLAYDELLADQLALALTRAHMRRSAGIERKGDGAIVAKVKRALPFALTKSQDAAVADILADLGKPQRMLRLLQGDVGSGKTVVAMLAMARAVESGGQAALMAPTELLARQHAETLGPIAEAAGLRLEVLTGREKGSERKRILTDLAGPADEDALPGIEPRPGIDILVGTHALFQEGIAFRDLALAVVDEQHRFGVQQRLALAAKGEATDVLVMTATPIPRSLVLATFGDMDVSQLREKPAGRRPVDTRAIPLERIDEVIERIAAAIARDGKVFWVCPLVEESEGSPLADAESRAAALRKALGQPVGLVHGRMSAAEKDREMERFRSGQTKVLVATTVIEVGVDVPDATIMVIEQAERFGLAQLHQLRGRIGRGDKSASCLLLYSAPLGPTAKRRLEILRETEDGFLIAEEDLKLRGEGELLGTRQAGVPGYRLANLAVHQPQMEAAHRDARAAVAENAELSGERGEALRILLYLFGRDAAVRLLRAG